MRPGNGWSNPGSAAPLCSQSHLPFRLPLLVDSYLIFQGMASHSQKHLLTTAKACLLRKSPAPTLHLRAQTSCHWFQRGSMRQCQEPITWNLLHNQPLFSSPEVLKTQGLEDLYRAGLPSMITYLNSRVPLYRQWTVIFLARLLLMEAGLCPAL